MRLVDAVRASSALLVDLLHTRLALFSHEIEIELDRIRVSAFLLVGALVCLALAITLIVFFAVAAFWDTHRLAAIGGSSSVLLFATWLLALRLRRRLTAGPPPFCATLRELRADAGALCRVDTE